MGTQLAGAAPKASWPVTLRPEPAFVEKPLDKHGHAELIRTRRYLIGCLDRGGMPIFDGYAETGPREHRSVTRPVSEGDEAF